MATKLCLEAMNMTEPPRQNKKHTLASDYWLGIGIAIGAGVGWTFGTMAGNVAMGVAIGVAVGIVFWATVRANR
jgi:hypothetical protein